MDFTEAYALGAQGLYIHFDGNKLLLVIISAVCQAKVLLVFS